MKNTIKTAFALALTMFVSIAANAQTNTNAVVNFSGIISPSVDMRIVGVTNNSSGTTVNSSSATQATIDFGELSPNRLQSSLTNGHSAFTVNVALRSNTTYRVQANSALGGTVGTGKWELDDIGFGVLAPTATGPTVSSGSGSGVFPGATGITVGTNASSTDPAASAVVAGTPSYAKTLSDIKENSDIITGGRISYQGNVNTPDNAIVVPLRFASAPQFFDPETRTGSVVFDIFPTP